jgi:hypothetical protein
MSDTGQRISLMTKAAAPYSSATLFEVSVPSGGGVYGTFSTSLDDIVTSLEAAGISAEFPENSILVPTTGQTLDVPDVSKTILNPAGALASLTLRLPAVADGRSLRISTRQRIDSLTLIALGGHNVDWAVGELPANGAIDLTLVTSLNSWVRA